ncbi:MAG: NnrS family protein, partial [Hyphomicrobiales bacterium]|nr:NnrS family protein [Hyphomicrobiales bacterium]
VVMIIVIGGRVIPGFTTNTLRRQGVEDRLPLRRAPVDMACLVLSVAAIVFLAVDVAKVIIGMAALGAAVANAVRLAGWRSLATLRQPILWVLHLGYGWIVVAFALLGVAMLSSQVSEIAAFHAFGTGAVGTMTLAIMSRAALGHTGRPIVAPRPVVAAYLLVTVSALLRTFGPTLAPGLYSELMLLSGAAWIVAFALFTAVFAPILLQPRVRGDQGA